MRSSRQIFSCCVGTVLTLLLASAGIATAAPGDIDRFAGGPGVAGSATLVAQQPIRVAVHDGGIYLSDVPWSVIRRVDVATGLETVVAGVGRRGFSGDGGPATSAHLADPRGIAFDSAGNLFIADTGNHRVRRVDAATGIIETIAGSDLEAHAGDGGPATSAGFTYPEGVAVAGNGDVYVVDTDENRIRRIDALSGLISTFAGTGERGFSGDGGPASTATFAFPSAIQIDAAGRLLVADGDNRRIRRIDTAGTISTLYLNWDVGGVRDVAVAPDGRVYASKISAPFVVRVDDGSGALVTGWTSGFSGDGGLATSARLESPEGLAFDDAGNLYIADVGNRRARRIDRASGIITTIAGNGSCCTGGDGGPARDAQMLQDQALGFDLSGNVLTVNRVESRVRRIDVRTGIIDAVAGTGTSGFSGDSGPASAAQLNYPTSAIGDARGNVFIADRLNARIRRVDGSSGVITTIAGNGSARVSSDGAGARTSSIGFPTHLALDRDGNLYFGERATIPTEVCAIRRIDAATGLLATVIGGTDCQERGDGGPALAAGIGTPERFALDPRGGIVFIDNLHLRRIDFTTGTVERIFGNDEIAFTPDGMPAAGSSAAYPSGVGVDSQGNVFVAELDARRIRRIDAVTGLLSTAAGNGAAGWDGAGDGGPAPLAELWSPEDVVVTHSDRIYISEGFANRIRVVDGGSRCGDWTVDPGESCDDGNVVVGDCCSPTCQLVSAGTMCRAATGVCDVAEACDGASGFCPAQGFAASGAACTSDGKVCTDDVCDGSGSCLHPNNTASCADGLFCNGADTCAAGTCSVHAGDPCAGGPECAATCDEARDSCNVAAGLPCSDDGSFCTEDHCDGSGACVHPPARAGQTCRGAAGDCDVAEVCDGVSPTCPANVLRPATVVCRGAAGECDRAESCSGTSPICPSDAFLPVGTSCTPDALACTTDVCDAHGACTHPAGNAGTLCRSAIDVCDVAETCDGTSGACPSDVFAPATVVCRNAAGECDLADRCSGIAATCPLDARRPSGTSCAADGEVCTADVCDGSSISCTHPPGNAGVACRAARDACDLVEVCDGSTAACPADTVAADADTDGTCDAQDACTNPDGERAFVSPPRSSVVLSRINTDPHPTDDTLALSAYLALPEGRSFAELRPHLAGARVVLTSAGGTKPLDATLPPGMYTTVARYGWSQSSNGKTWTYVDRRATPVSGIVKLTFVDRSRASKPRLVKVGVTGKKGAYAVTPADLPLQASVTLGDAADAAAGMCGESAFVATSCAFNRSGNRLVCLR